MTSSATDARETTGRGAESWGPLPRLADLLDSPPAGPPEDDRSWWQAAERYGGLWAAYSRPSWPQALRPPAHPSPRPGLMTRLLKRRKAPIRPSQGLEALIREMVACHAWLGSQNLRAAQHWFSPLWQTCPTELAVLTQSGLAWSVLASRLRPRRKITGMNDVLRLAASLPPLDEDATLGDFLALHLSLERLVDEAGRVFAAGLREGTQRCLGGLRSRRFLTVYPDLVVRARSLGATGWLKILERLVGVSPLTQAIYPDLLGLAQEDAHFGPLSRPGRQGRAWPSWGELWLTLLARTVVAAVSSPPPALELLLHAQEEVQKATAAATRRARRDERPIEEYPPLVKAEKALQEARDLSAQQERQRPALLTRILGQTRQDPGSPFLALRTMDMLVRGSVASADKALRAQWARAEPSMPRRMLARDLAFAGPSEVAQLIRQYRQERGEDAPALFGSRGAGFGAVVDLLLPERWSHEERPYLQVLLDPPTMGDCAGRPGREFLESPQWQSAVAEAGLEDAAARRLVDRYYNVPVHLPLTPPHDAGFSPAEVLALIRKVVT